MTITVQIGGSDLVQPYVNAAKGWADDARATAATLAALTGAILPRPALAWAGMGDSHTNGMLLNAAAGDGSAVTIGAQYPLGPLDRTWNGTGTDPVARLDSAINTQAGSTDTDWSAVATGTAGWLSMLPAVLRAGYPYLGEITTANLGVGGSSAYTWAGEQAMTFVRAGAQANAGDTVTVAGQAYTFRASPAANFDVQIGADAKASLANLVNAINGEGGGYFASTPPNANCWAHGFGDGTFARVRAMLSGIAGNSITIAGSSTARISPVDGSLAPVSSRNLSGGSATSALYQTAKAKLAGGPGLIPRVNSFTLGTNEAIRPGYRGRTMQAELTKLIATAHADYPGALLLFHRPPVVGTGAAATAALTNNVLPAIDAVVAANPGFCASFDVFGLGAGSGRTAILNATDGIHLTPYGYSLETQLATRTAAQRLGL